MTAKCCDGRRIDALLMSFAIIMVFTSAVTTLVQLHNVQSRIDDITRDIKTESIPNLTVHAIKAERKPYVAIITESIKRTEVDRDKACRRPMLPTSMASLMLNKSAWPRRRVPELIACLMYIGRHMFLQHNRYMCMNHGLCVSPTS